MTNNAKRVLIVDDNSIMRMLLRTLLRSEEFVVVGEASNGEQAIEMAQRFTPDVICLDVEMPKLGGLDVLAQLRQSVPAAAVLMVTAHADRETVQAAIEGGAAGYIVKPFSVGRVLEAVTAAAAKSAQAPAA